MHSVLLQLVLLFIASGADDLVVRNPDGAVLGAGKTSVTSEDGKTTINLNLNIRLNGVGGPLPAGTAAQPSGAVTPTQGTGIPTQGTGVPTRQPPASLPQPPAGKGPDPSGPPASTPGTSFEQDGLNAHNYYRAYHDSPPMTLNTAMNSAAAVYAQKLAGMGDLQHSGRSEREGQGENLYMSCTSKGSEATPSEAVKSWYDEVCSPGYPFGSVQSPGGAGHFTQVVWSDSTELGIGKGTGQQGGMKCTYVVARYKPLGNFNTGNDDYNKNVKKGANFDEQKYCSGQRSQQGGLGGGMEGFGMFDSPQVQLGAPESENMPGGALAQQAHPITLIHLTKKAKILSKKRHHRSR